MICHKLYLVQHRGSFFLNAIKTWNIIIILLLLSDMHYQEFPSIVTLILNLHAIIYYIYILYSHLYNIYITVKTKLS